jgi:DNA-nicking Smr family endonuclease
MPRSGKPGPRGRHLDADEDWLWREAMRDVRPYRPLPASTIRPVRAEAAPKAAKKIPVPSALSPRPAQIGSQGLGSGVDGATARRLAQGRSAPDATLDLHGMTQDHAHAALERFLAVSVAHGRRCVLVITGKGGLADKRDDGDAPWARRRPGVLKSLVPLWLEHSAQRDNLASVRAAHVKHGGGGALYVYLRSRR